MTIEYRTPMNGVLFINHEIAKRLGALDFTVCSPGGRYIAVTTADNRTMLWPVVEDTDADKA